MAGGYALFLPDEDNMGLQSLAYFKADMVVAMGGRASEEIVFGPEEITTAAPAGKGIEMTLASRVQTMAIALAVLLAMTRLLGADGLDLARTLCGRDAQRRHGQRRPRQVDREGLHDAPRPRGQQHHAVSEHDRLSP